MEDARSLSVSSASTHADRSSSVFWASATAARQVRMAFHPGRTRRIPIFNATLSIIQALLSPDGQIAVNDNGRLGHGDPMLLATLERRWERHEATDDERPHLRRVIGARTRNSGRLPSQRFGAFLFGAAMRRQPWPRAALVPPPPLVN
jgi:hypothetical protein